MLLIPGTANGERGTGNGERGTGNREREYGNKCTAGTVICFCSVYVIRLFQDFWILLWIVFFTICIMIIACLEV